MRLFTRNDTNVKIDNNVCLITIKNKIKGSFIWCSPLFNEGSHGWEIYYFTIPNHIKELLSIKLPEKSRYISLKTKEYVFERDQGVCQECGNDEDIEIDHIKPFSKGGENNIQNLQLLCRPCNRRKYNKY